MSLCLHHQLGAALRAELKWISKRYSRLSLGGVLRYGDGEGGVGELWGSGTSHHRDHRRGATAAQPVCSDDGQQVLPILLQRETGGPQLAILSVYFETSVTTCRHMGHSHYCPTCVALDASGAYERFRAGVCKLLDCWLKKASKICKWRMPCLHYNLNHPRDTKDPPKTTKNCIEEPQNNHVIVLSITFKNNIKQPVLCWLPWAAPGSIWITAAHFISTKKIHW